MSNLPAPVRITLEVAARTHVGVKRTENEDRVLVADLEGRAAHVGTFSGRLEVGSGGALLAVCDGMGGEAGGEIASATAVATLYREALGSLPGRSSLGVARGLLEAVQAASRDIEQLGAIHTELSRMGTTATVCAVADETLVFAQVGDSRAYLLRGERLVQLTRDQTLATLLLERGQLTPDQLGSFEFSHVILQALGHTGGVDVDLGALRLARGDVLLICSDGLYGCVDDVTLAATLRSHQGMSDVCDELIRLALAAGAPDNVSCLVARANGAFAHDVDACPRLDKVVLPVEPLEPPSPTAPITSAPSCEVSATDGPLARLRAFFQGTH
jgi:PPM family protein phosphatase